MTAAPLLLIVGMHRSGTSLLGSLLPACGIAMPGPLISGDRHNPEGYFERADVTALQEQLLIDLERWWPSPRGMHPLPEGWLESPLGQGALADLITLLQPEAERQHGPWAIKDPRSSLLLPLWKAACQQLGIPLKLLLAVRDPAEVVVSLVRRDQAATGMDGWRAQRLWWHHNAQVLQDGADLPLQVVSYSHWFEPAHAVRQLQGLAPQLDEAALRAALAAVKPEHRRSRQQKPDSPLTPRVRQLYSKLAALALAPAAHQSRTQQDLSRWVSQQQPLPHSAPLPRCRSRLKQWLKRRLQRHNDLDPATHPWGYLAEMVCGSQAPAAAHQIQWWETHGFRAFELERFEQLSGPALAAPSWAGGIAQQTITVQLRGDRCSWASYAWLQHCPIAEEIKQINLEALGSPDAAPIALNLLPLEPGPGCGRDLLHLAGLDAVWDPDPQRVQLLRQFGISAYWLQPARQPHPALQPGAAIWAQCSQTFGLPAPATLRALGSTICLGLSQPDLEQELSTPLLGIPGFNHLPVTTPGQARLLAQWLQGCLNAGLELVYFTGTPKPWLKQAWQGLIQHTNPQTAPILLLPEPMGRSELLAELDWHRQGAATPSACITPQPSSRCLVDAYHRQATTSVCISLYNYGDRIEHALSTVHEQINAKTIELIVVNDASTDQGASVVANWMQQNHEAFARCLLLEHEQNGGLASARNTAFAAATTEWCFVLDADNAIAPDTIDRLQAVANSADGQCAVVHSLVRVLADDTNADTRHLVSDRPWIRQLFEQSNYIDAMALVRRSAWNDVGGYTHIEGGWEDYDFWCCLIDAGWHGEICPQTLASYISHNTSMRSSTSDQNSYALSRLLQARHPWLNLPKAQDHAVQPHQIRR